jgi:hypothetical protein
MNATTTSMFVASTILAVSAAGSLWGAAGCTLAAGICFAVQSSVMSVCNYLERIARAEERRL